MDAALLVAVSHIVDVAQNLELVTQIGDDGIQAIGDESDLLVEGSVSVELVNGNGREESKVALGTRSLSEQPVRF